VNEVEAAALVLDAAVGLFVLTGGDDSLAYAAAVKGLVAAAEQRGRESLREKERRRWSALEQVENLMTQRDAALIRAEQAEALRKFAQHLPRCESWDNSDPNVYLPCSCGLKAALDATEAQS
jgi:hypothetical protein